MKYILSLLVACALTAPAAALTPEELSAMVDKRAAAADPFQALLNDPNPIRSMAAMELMIESGVPHLVRTAVDFGLLSALPEIRRAAVFGFLTTRPTLLVTLNASSSEDEGFEAYFRSATAGTVLSDGTATFSVNVGEMDADKNCFVRTGTEDCAVEIGPTGLSIYKSGRYQGRDVHARSILVFSTDGTLAGATSIDNVNGGFPTTLRIAN